MNRALLVLLGMQMRNRLRVFAGRLRRPTYVLTTLLFLGILGIQLLPIEHLADASAKRREGVFLLTALLLLQLIAGFQRQGIAFRQAEVDFLFPGPFSPRELLAYRLLQLGIPSVLGGVMLGVFGGRSLPHVSFGCIALATYVLFLTNVQVASSMTILNVSRRFAAAVRWFAFFAALTLIAGLIAIMAVRPGEELELRNTIEESEPFLWASWPARVAVDAANATSLQTFLQPWALLLAILAGSYAVLLLPSRAFLEASFATSERMSRALRRFRRSGELALPGSELHRVMESRPPAFLRGAGAIVWRHAVELRRAPGTLIVPVLFLSLGGAIGGRALPLYSEQDAMQAVTMGGLVVSLYLSVLVRSDFRKDLRNAVVLKSLPVSPFGLAVAETCSSAMVVTVLQAVILIPGLCVLHPLPSSRFFLTFFPACTGFHLLLSAAANVEVLLFPPRLSSLDEDTPPQFGPAAMAVGMRRTAILAIVGLVPAAVGVVVGFLITREPLGAIVGGGLTALASCAALVVAQGLLFERLDLAREA